ncbi:MAG: triose-phosphate isomerase [Gammaproteobacteria bacterium]|nr:MAG: triose-phosphate isomerase [Gammaproteobacteria bacterium]
MRQPMIAGNWKMNGSSDSVKELIAGIKAGMSAVNRAQVVVCPPAVYIPQVSADVSGSKIRVGSQNICDQDKGAFTGEIAGSMLKDLACNYAIIGHSERRSLYGESDELVARRYAAERRNGITPIFCIGETLDEREQGITNEVCSRQIDAVIALEGVEALADGVIAYEPVWAIGTGKTATKEQAQEAHAFIREKLVQTFGGEMASGIRILYGGSVKPGNVRDLMAMPDIDGALVGGASLKPDTFAEIIHFGA